MEEMLNTEVMEDTELLADGQTEADEAVADAPADSGEDIEEIKRQYAESREVLDKILKGSGASDLAQLREKMEEAEYRAALKSGMSPEAAKIFMKNREEMQRLRDMEISAGYEREVSRLRELPFYSDIDAVSDRVCACARQKTISVQEAYNALYAESRAGALSEAAKREGEADAAKRQSRKIAALSGGGNAPGRAGTGLSAEEIWAAKTANISPEEYLKYKKSGI